MKHRIAIPLALAAATLAACGRPAPEQPADPGNTITSAGAIEPAANAAAVPEVAPTPEPGDAATPIAAAPTPPAPSPTAMVERDYLGRWIGVEGTYLNVVAKPSGGVTLDMQWDLDNKGKFDGSVTAEGLRFIRDGKPELLAPSDGDATGLKWLAGKKRCLTVKPGEGYCRA